MLHLSYIHLRVPYVTMSFLVVTFSPEHNSHLQNYYWSTMNLLIFYIPVLDCHTVQYTVHEYLLNMIALM